VVHPEHRLIVFPSPRKVIAHAPPAAVPPPPPRKRYRDESPDDRRQHRPRYDEPPRRYDPSSPPEDESLFDRGLQEAIKARIIMQAAPTMRAAEEMLRRVGPRIRGVFEDANHGGYRQQQDDGWNGRGRSQSRRPY
jgi:hypothetical protein